MGAAMVINISPVITFAEPAVDNGVVFPAEAVAETGAVGAASGAGVEITETETEEVETAELETAEVETAETAEAIRISIDTAEDVKASDASAGYPTDNAQEMSARAEITDQTSLEAAIAQGGTIDLTGKTITLERPLTVNNGVMIIGGTLVGTAGVGYNNLVTLTGDEVTLDGVTIITAAENKSALHAYRTVLTANNLTIDHTNAAGGAPVIINGGQRGIYRKP